MTGSDQILLGDIGGTTARFALLGGAKLGPIAHIPVAKHPCTVEAIESFLGKHPGRGRLAGAILGVAGPVEAERCVVTNSHWALDGRELRSALAIERLDLINDFEAIAWSLPWLTGKDVRPLGGGKAVSNDPMVVIGPGTGLGMAAFIPRKVGALVVATEGGHATLPAGSTREDAAIEQLRQRFGHVSAERALSGAGLENLYRAIAASENVAVPERNAAEITQHALDGSCKISRAATDMFCAMLGSVAGNLALMFRARGGVYVAGGIAPRLVDYLAQSEFRARFVAKGRFRSYLDAVPTSVIVHEDAAFLGLRSRAHGLALQ
jgi:glucokinase